MKMNFSIILCKFILVSSAKQATFLQGMSVSLSINSITKKVTDRFWDDRIKSYSAVNAPSMQTAVFLQAKLIF